MVSSGGCEQPPNARFALRSHRVLCAQPRHQHQKLRRLAAGLLATPHEAMWSEKPDLSLLRVWGSPAYVHIPKHKVVKLNDDVATRRRKLDSKVRPAVFVGYADNFKAWRFYDPITNKYFVSRMATFNERHGDSTPTLVLLKQPQPPELELSTLGEQLSARKGEGSRLVLTDRY